MTMASVRRSTRAAALGLVVSAVVLMTGCNTVTTPSPTPAPTSPQAAETVEPPSEEETAASAALAAYTAYWEVTDAARAAPGSRDWRPAIEQVARGQAVETAMTDVENYASLPAHSVGTITRSPSVAQASATRVSITDCVDLGDAGVVSDTTGERLDDLENRVQRFRLYADVVAESDGRWVVERTSPALDETC
jgi:hypothetical protein